MSNPKTYSTNESFVRMIINDFELSEEMRKHMNGPWRVWEVALIRLNNYGHAPFREGELVTKVCGSDTPSNRGRVRDWMKGLVAMKRIAPLGKGGSTQLCIMVNNRVVNRGAGRAMDYMCWEPSHADTRKQSWSDIADAEVGAEVISNERHYTLAELMKVCEGHDISCDCDLCIEMWKLRDD